jgi:hypothetical protein
MAFENCSFESSGRLLESVSNYRSRWMVIRSQERQDPAYRATLHYFSNLLKISKTDVASTCEAKSHQKLNSFGFSPFIIYLEHFSLNRRGSKFGFCAHSCKWRPIYEFSPRDSDNLFSPISPGHISSLDL